MNLCALASLLSVGVAIALGAISGSQRGLGSGILGAVIGLVIGFVVTFGVFSAEKRIHSTPRGQDPVGSGIALSLLFAIFLLAPAIAGSTSYFVGDAVSQLIFTR